MSVCLSHIFSFLKPSAIEDLLGEIVVCLPKSELMLIFKLKIYGFGSHRQEVKYFN